MTRLARNDKPLLDDRVRFFKANSEVIAWISDNAHWSAFANSLTDQLSSGKIWTPRQLAAATSMMNKVEASRATRQAEKEREQEKPKVVDLNQIRELFETAKANGLKTPKIYLGELRLSLATDSSKNPGFVYVVRNSSYQGKISPAGEFVPRFGVNLDLIMKELIELVADPFAAMTAHGKKTGQCSCCGRELTNPVSIKLGIGPICRERFGL